MSSFSTAELFDAVIARLTAAVWRGTAETIFTLVKAPAVFDIANGYRYAANLPCALVLFDGQKPDEEAPAIVETSVGIVLLTAGPPEEGVDQWDEASLIGTRGLLDIVTSVRQAMAFHEGADDDFEIRWGETGGGFILARRDMPSRLIGVELKFTAKHQDLTTP